MMDNTKKTLGTWLAMLLVASVCGGIAGGLAGFSAARSVTPAASPVGNASGTSAIPEAKPPTNTITLISVERPALTSVTPAAFHKNRAPQLATLYRAPRTTSFDDRLLEQERSLGQAVALTSDGWFVAVASQITGLKRADFLLWYNGQAYPIERGITDTLNGTVYLKVAAKDIPSATFARVRDLVTGIEVWTEQRSGELTPQVVTDLDYRLQPNASYSSEIVARRILLSGTALSDGRGSAVWDGSGKLVGLVESAADEPLRLIPVSSIDSSFASLMQNGEIRHVVLGVRALDLAGLRLAGSRGDLPALGAYLREDKKNPAILRDSPAEKAKLKIGDVILNVERDILDGTMDLGEVLSEYKPGSKVTLRIRRAGQDLDVSVTLGSHLTSEALK